MGEVHYCKCGAEIRPHAFNGILLRCIGAKTGGDVYLCIECIENGRLDLHAKLDELKAKTLKCFHCCDLFPAVEALQFGDKVFCSEECSKLYVKVIHYK
jgi:hypothetical protein